MMKVVYNTIFAALYLMLLFFGASCTPEGPDHPTEKLWYREPASIWEEALPLGNGRLGAMVYGDPEIEHLKLNEESLWAGTPEDPYPENIRIHYARFRELAMQQKFQQAWDYGMKNLVVSPSSFRSYEPLGDLYIQFGDQGLHNYTRSLDMETGIAEVEYKTENSKICREAFISTEYDVVVYHVTRSDGEALNCNLYFDREEDVLIHIDDNHIINIEGQVFDDEDGYDDNPGRSGKGGYHMKFCSKIAVEPGNGRVEVQNNRLNIVGSDEFTVILSAATDYNPDSMNYDRNINPEKRASGILNRALNIPYEKIREQHVRDHSSVYNRVELKLSDLEEDTIPTDVRIQNMAKGDTDTWLQQLYFQYGRYLLMTSSGGNAVLPAHLQGIWSKDMWSPFESDYHMDINTQMNYWPADLCNLSETVIPLADWMLNLSEKGAITAQNYLGSDGWVAHFASNAFGRTTPGGSDVASQLQNGYSFPLAGAWMSLTLWRHYEFTLDRMFLEKRAYPVISGAARFILDLLMEDKNGQLLISPSYSPENTYIDPATGEAVSITIGSAADMQIVREIFNACLQSERILSSQNLTSEIESALKILPPIRIGANGTIQEWNKDYKEHEPSHRHISHLLALYPFNQINSSTQELFDAAGKTIERRLETGGGHTGWSLAHTINVYARLMDGNEALFHLNRLIADYTRPNLFDALYKDGIFQIDGNLGGTAGIAEMLLQSHETGIIRLLPALPAAWKNGFVKGLKARGNFLVDMEWKNGELEEAKIKALSGGEVDLIYQGEKVSIELEKGEVYLLSL